MSTCRRVRTQATFRRSTERTWPHLPRARREVALEGQDHHGSSSFETVLLSCTKVSSNTIRRRPGRARPTRHITAKSRQFPSHPAIRMPARSLAPPGSARRGRAVGRNIWFRNTAAPVHPVTGTGTCLGVLPGCGEGVLRRAGDRPGQDLQHARAGLHVDRHARRHRTDGLAADGTLAERVVPRIGAISVRSPVVGEARCLRQPPPVCRGEASR